MKRILVLSFLAAILSSCSPLNQTGMDTATEVCRDRGGVKWASPSFQMNPNFYAVTCRDGFQFDLRSALKSASGAD